MLLLSLLMFEVVCLVACLFCFVSFRFVLFRCGCVFIDCSKRRMPLGFLVCFVQV